MRAVMAKESTGGQLMNERDRLLGELSDILPCTCIEAYKSRGLSAPDCAGCNHIEDVVDWIIEDRKRIVQPIIDFSNQEHDTDTYEIRGAKAMVDTLKLAGLTA